MTVAITEQQRRWLLETLRWSRRQYEEAAAKYLFADNGEDYRRNVYEPRLQMFDDMKSKIEQAQEEE